MPSKHTPYFNLRDALLAPGCALCRLAQGAVDRFLAQVSEERVNDHEVQTALKAAHGFCPTHSAQLLRHRDTLGTAILYNAILGHLLAELPAEAGPEKDWLGRLTTRLQRAQPALDLPPHAPCPACTQREETATRALAVLQAHHADPELIAAIQTSPGFCLPHLRQAMTQLESAGLQLILERQRAAWEALRAELAELIRKNDYRFAAEAFGTESDAWERAVRSIVGEPGVF